MSTESIDPRFANYQRSPELKKRLDDLHLVDEPDVELNPELDREEYRVAVVAGRWHLHIVDALIDGALTTLNKYGVDDDQIDFVQAPGAFEFPLVVQTLLDADDDYDAVIVLGVGIRGETPHFDFVAGECARGLTQVSLEYDTPVGFGVLTVNDVDQALARAQNGESNKGREAVLAALEVADLRLVVGDDE